MADGSQPLPLYLRMAQDCLTLEEKLLAGTNFAAGSLLGFVVGLQNIDDGKELRKIAPFSTFLVPGFGAQGGDIGRLKEMQGEGRLQVSASRSITYPQPVKACDAPTNSAASKAATGGDSWERLRQAIFDQTKEHSDRIAAALS